MGDLIVIYPKPDSIYLRGTTRMLVEGLPSSELQPDHAVTSPH